MDFSIKLNTVEPSETSVPITIIGESIKLLIPNRRIPVYIVIQNVIIREGQFPKEFAVEATSGEIKHTFHFARNDRSSSMIASQNEVNHSADYSDLELTFNIGAEFTADVLLVY